MPLPYFFFHYRTERTRFIGMASLNVTSAASSRMWCVLQCVVVCCSVLQCVVVCCSVLQRGLIECSKRGFVKNVVCVCVCMHALRMYLINSVLQHVAVHSCSVYVPRYKHNGITRTQTPPAPPPHTPTCTHTHTHRACQTMVPRSCGVHTHTWLAIMCR